jgi:hypothetical protein
LGGVNLPFGGGFYNRVLPYPLIRWGIRRLHAEGLPAVLYLHPWELDTAQPVAKVTPRERVTHYGGRRSLFGKLERLLAEFRFAPMSQLLDSMAESEENSRRAALGARSRAQSVREMDQCR